MNSNKSYTVPIAEPVASWRKRNILAMRDNKIVPVHQSLSAKQGASAVPDNVCDKSHEIDGADNNPKKPEALSPGLRSNAGNLASAPHVVNVDANPCQQNEPKIAAISFVWTDVRNFIPAAGPQQGSNSGQRSRGRLTCPR